MTGQLGRAIDSFSRRARTGEGVPEPAERPDPFDVLQRMTVKLRSAAPIGELLDELAGSVREALEADVVLVRVLNPELDRMAVHGSAGVPPPQLGRILGERTRVTRDFRALRPGSLISYTDERPLVLQHADLVETSEVQALMGLGATYLLVLPLHVRGELVGRLDVLRRRDARFGVPEGQFAVTLATVVACAVAGPARQDPAERYDQIIEASFAFQQSLAPLASVGETLQSVVEAVSVAIPCARCYGLLWEPEREEFAAVAVVGAEADRIERLKRTHLAPQSVPLLQGLLTADGPLEAASEREDQLPPWLVETLGMQRALAVPLRARQERVIGALLLDKSEEGQDVSGRDLAVLSVIAPYAAMLVEHALLYEEARRSSDRLALVNGIGIELASLTDLEHLFRQLCLHVASVMSAGRFCVGLVLPDGQQVEYRYAVDGHFKAEPVVSPLGDDPLSRAVRERQPMLLERRGSDDSGPWFPAEQPAPPESMLAVPIQVGHRAIGVIGVFSESREAFTRGDLDLLVTLGMQTGVAIENSRLYTMAQATGERRAYLLDQMLTRHEAERKTIAEDIHNDTLQTLASCLYSLDLISRRASEVGPERTQAELATVRENLSQNIDRLRQIIFQIRPSTLDILGLGPALREHAGYVERGTGVSISIEVELAERPPSEVETAVYRVVQEAIDEVRGRPGVSHIVIRIKRNGPQLIATIADNGEPVAPDHGDDDRGTGPLPPALMRLIALRERTELAGGTLRTAKLPGGGTAVQIVLPAGGAV